MARETAKTSSRKVSAKGRTSKAKDKAAQVVESPAAAPLDAEVRRTRLKTLITLGKERGYLTYAEISDHLPDDVADAEQIEGIIATFNNMGIQVYDAAPAAEDILMSDNVASNVDEDVAEEEAEQALSSVDSEFGRTTDPVRMYMREMGTVELLTREGEIEIAKRIEDGLKHMVQAISACPTTIAEMLSVVDRVIADEAKIDELIDGLIDPNAGSEGAAEDDTEDDSSTASSEDENEADEDNEDETDEESAERANAASLLQLKNDALARFAIIRELYAKKMEALQKRGSQDTHYLRCSNRFRTNCSTSASPPRPSSACATRCATWSSKCAATNARSCICASTLRHAARAVHQGLPRPRNRPRVAQGSRLQPARTTPRT
jgi:RNA polymerase primary sigma factor